MRKQIYSLKQLVVKFKRKIFFYLDLMVVMIFLAIILFTPNNIFLKKTDYNRKPTIVNGHRLKPDISSDETDIYSDGFTQQRRLNPQPKIRFYKLK